MSLFNFWKGQLWSCFRSHALHAPIPHVNNAEEAEAVASIKALEFARDLGMRNVILEGDALGVIAAINGHSPDFSTIGNIIQDARDQCGEFQSCQIQHVPRQANTMLPTPHVSQTSY